MSRVIDILTLIKDIITQDNVEESEDKNEQAIEEFQKKLTNPQPILRYQGSKRGK